MVAKSLRLSPPCTTRIIGASPSFCLIYSFAIRAKGYKDVKVWKIKHFFYFCQKREKTSKKEKGTEKNGVKDTLFQIILRGRSY